LLTLIHSTQISWMERKECVWIMGSCVNEYTCSFCWTWEITLTYHKLYCVHCSVGLHVCLFVRLVWKWLVRQVGRASPLPFSLNVIFSIQWLNLKQTGLLYINFKAISSNVDHNFVPVLCVRVVLGYVWKFIYVWNVITLNQSASK
jgi:hypothetical protein